MAAKSGEGPFFGPEGFRFLRELGQNNNREWFQKNKTRYENAVQAPALRFIGAMGGRLAKFAPHVVADARPFGGSLSRIYRDTRFAKDKSPYRTSVGIHFAHEDAGKSERHLPGFYLHVAPGESMVVSGIWHPEAPDLKRIRDRIVAEPAEWGRAIPVKIPLGGESYVRVPAGYDPNHRYADDLRRKDFIASHPFLDSDLSGARFGTKFVDACRRLDPLNSFLADAIGAPW
jgi:uncharacterized protein (TIGR02453 family)